MAGDSFGLDTNILVYTVSPDDPRRQRRALDVVARAAQSGRCVLAVQNITEFVNVATRRRRGAVPLMSVEAAVTAARDLLTLFPGLARPDESALVIAFAEVENGRASWWDAVLASTLALAGCTALLSEDMHDGGEVAGVRILDPFAGDELPAAVAGLLAAPA